MVRHALTGTGVPSVSVTLCKRRQTRTATNKHPTFFLWNHPHTHTLPSRPSNRLVSQLALSNFQVHLDLEFVPSVDNILTVCIFVRRHKEQLQTKHVL